MSCAAYITEHIQKLLFCGRINAGGSTTFWDLESAATIPGTAIQPLREVAASISNQSFPSTTNVYSGLMKYFAQWNTR